MGARQNIWGRRGRRREGAKEERRRERKLQSPKLKEINRIKYFVIFAKP